ncbi:hypothetical protein ACFV8V_13555 [Mammaliicoccus sciuri]|uniref:hypothetical protein n=1 Tax=Mammaliicoccus sciuri TaxID=1296 RepID=UPI001951BBDE
MLTWLLFLKLIDGEYVIVQSGSNILPTEEYDKVLPTTEQIARQADKVYFDGEKLILKNGMELLSVDELNDQLKDIPIKINDKKVIYDIE